MNHATMKVSVASVPRPQEVPHLTCLHCDKGRQPKFDKFPKSRSAPKPSTSQPEPKSIGLDQYNLKSLESHHRRKKSSKSGDQSPDQSESSRSDRLDGNLCPSRPKSPRVSDEDDGCSDSSSRSEQGQGSNLGQASGGKKSLYHKPPSGRKLNLTPESLESSGTISCDLKKEINVSMQSVSPGSSKGNLHHCYAKKLLKDSLKDKPLSFKQETHSKLLTDPDSHSKHYLSPDTLVKRLPSPKVLFTTNPKNQTTTYKKRKLDLDDLSENVEDKIMSSNISDLMKPLHSEELESYLSSLSHRLPEKAIHDNINSIPLTKCKFFIGDENQEVQKSNEDRDDCKIFFVQNSKTSDVEIQKTQDKTGTKIHEALKTSTGNDFDPSRERNLVQSPSCDHNDILAFQKSVDTSDLQNNEEQNCKTKLQKQDLKTTSNHGNERSKQHSSRHQPSKESVTRCLFKSLSEPGPDLEKLSLSMVQDGYHGYRTSHDGSPNGLSFTDDESSDNSTPTNSLSDNYTNNIFSQNSTSQKGRESNVFDSLEKEIANLKLTENNHVQSSHRQTDRNDKVALSKSLCKHLMTKELTKLGRVSLAGD